MSLNAGLDFPFSHMLCGNACLWKSNWFEINLMTAEAFGKKRCWYETLMS